LPPEAREKWSAAKTPIISILDRIDADDPAIISQKAHRLSFLYERICMGAEIITDVLPVYTIRGDKILEMMIQHKLVITQHDSEHDDSDVHFVMDARDVINLKNSCERAIQKAKVLQDSLGNLPWVTELLSEDEQT
jgi:hypothetical protein